MVFVEEGTALPLLAASGVALAQHHCNNGTSSVCCPHFSWAALGICFSCSLLITCCFYLQKVQKLQGGHSKLTPRSWCSFTLKLPPYLPWSCSQLVLKRNILHCCGGSAGQTLKMLQSFSWCLMFKRWADVFLSSTRYLYFSSSEGNGVSSLWLPEIILVGRSSQRKDKCQQ